MRTMRDAERKAGGFVMVGAGCLRGKKRKTLSRTRGKAEELLLQKISAFLVGSRVVEGCGLGVKEVYVKLQSR